MAFTALIGILTYIFVTKYVEALKGQSPIHSQTVRTEKKLVAALKKSKTFKGLSFIELILDRTDCNKALLGWGTAVADYNAGKSKATAG